MKYLSVCSPAANSKRRGVGSNKPLGKGPNTKSDIDYVAPQNSIPYFDQKKLPSIDPKTGIIPGYGNPFIGNVIRFEPYSKPVYVPKQNGG